MANLAALRVFAMARPRLPSGERGLVRAAAAEIGAAGSARAVAAALAERVAAHALDQLDRDDFGAQLAQLALAATAPALAALAFGEDGAALIAVQRAALAEFKRRGYRHAPPGEWGMVDARVRAEAARRLGERYRRALK